MQEIFFQSLRIVWYYKSKIVLFTLCLSALTALGSFLWLKIDPVYEAATVVTMLPSQAEIGLTAKREDMAGNNAALVLTQTHTEFLLSRPIISKVVQELINTYTLPKKDAFSEFVSARIIEPLQLLFWKTYFSLNYATFKPQPKDVILTNKLRKNITIENIPGSYILSIKVKWKAPKIAQDAANLLARIYIENSAVQNRSSLTMARTFIETSLKESQDQLQGIEEKIEAFKRRSNISMFDQDVAILLNDVTEYREAKNKLELQLLELNAKIKSFESIQSPSSLAMLKAEKEATQERLSKVKSLVGEQERELNRLPSIEYELFQLEESRRSISTNIKGLQANLLEKHVAEAGILSTVRIIEPASLPVYPVFPAILLNTIIASMVSFLIALSLILVRESISKHIACPDDARLCGFSSVGLIPKPAHPRTLRLFSNTPWCPTNERVDKHVQAVLSALTPSEGCAIVQLDSFDLHTNHAEFWHRLQTMVPHKTLICAIGDVSVPLNPQAESTASKIASLSVNLDYLEWPLPSPSGSALSEQLKALAAQIRRYKDSYTLILIVTSPVRQTPFSEHLAQHAERVVLLANAHRQSSSDLHYYRERYAALNRPFEIVLTDCTWPADFLFR